MLDSSIFNYIILFFHVKKCLPLKIIGVTFLHTTQINILLIINRYSTNIIIIIKINRIILCDI